MNSLTWIAQLLVIIGAINWGLIGFFRFDLVAALFGGADSFAARIVYALVGIAGLLVGPLQTVGALLALAAGLGIVWRAGRSLPTVETAPEAASAGPDAAVATAV